MLKQFSESFASLWLRSEFVADDSRCAFEKENLIYTPSHDEPNRWEWIGREQAVWSGPVWFTMYQPLNNLPEYKVLVGLFVNTLEMSDVSINDCLEYLVHIGSQGDHLTCKEDEKIILLYSKLVELWREGSDTEGAKENIKYDHQPIPYCQDGVTDILRSQFEDKRLIWNPSSKDWCRPSACIWAEDNITLPNKVSLATMYKEHSSLFRDILGVKKPNVEMHVAFLIDKVTENLDKSDIIQEMRNISALDPEPETLRTKLRNCLCFPVRNSSGEIHWRS